MTNGIAPSASGIQWGVNTVDVEMRTAMRAVLRTTLDVIEGNYGTVSLSMLARAADTTEWDSLLARVRSVRDRFQTLPAAAEAKEPARDKYSQPAPERETPPVAE